MCGHPPPGWPPFYLVWLFALTVKALLMMSRAWFSVTPIPAHFVFQALAAGPGTPLDARYPPGQQEARTAGGPVSLLWQPSATGPRTSPRVPVHSGEQPAGVWPGLGPCPATPLSLKASHCSVSWWPDSLICEGAMQRVSLCSFHLSCSSLNPSVNILTNCSLVTQGKMPDEYSIVLNYKVFNQ